MILTDVITDACRRARQRGNLGEGTEAALVGGAVALWDSGRHAGAVGVVKGTAAGGARWEDLLVREGGNGGDGTLLAAVVRCSGRKCVSLVVHCDRRDLGWKNWGGMYP